MRAQLFLADSGPENIQLGKPGREHQGQVPRKQGAPAMAVNPDLPIDERRLALDRVPMGSFRLHRINPDRYR